MVIAAKEEGFSIHMDCCTVGPAFDTDGTAITGARRYRPVRSTAINGENGTDRRKY